LAVYQGDSLEALREVASNDDYRGVQSLVSFASEQGVEYLVAVDGKFGATGDIVLNWRPQGPPANNHFATAKQIDGPTGTVTADNTDATKEEDEPDHAGMRGGKSVWYRWTAPQDGTVTFDTIGSTFDTLLAVYQGDSLEALREVASNDDYRGVQSLVSFASEQGVEYLVAVDGYLGAAGNVVLNWQLRPAPLNDHFASAERLEGMSGVRRTSNTTATMEEGEPDHAGMRGGKSVWYRWTAPQDGTVTFDTIGSTFDTLLAVYQGDSLEALREVASNDDYRGVQSLVSFASEQGVEYLVAVDGKFGAAGDIILLWSTA
jgi:uncharacterized protein YijF (DUF1287 family)